MIASLPMYDRPETAGANDRLWHRFRRDVTQYNTFENVDSPIPAKLTRTGDIWAQWLSPNLLLSQTCSLPYRSELHDKVTLLGVPVHKLDCPPGQYFSVVVIRKNDPRSELADFRNAILAYNDPMSQSGWTAPQATAEDLGFTFTKTRATGSHQNSARNVVDGKADLAAIDAVTWHLMRRYDPWTENLKILLHTPPTPALPFICAKGFDLEDMRNTLEDSINEMSNRDQETLLIQGFRGISPDAYLTLPTPPPPPH